MTSRAELAESMKAQIEELRAYQQASEFVLSHLAAED